MLLENERLNFYFDDAMEEIDYQKVLSLWKNETKLTHYSPHHSTQLILVWQMHLAPPTVW
jgi:hypothetical protein